MHLVFFTHPPFLGSQSMPRFTRMLVTGMQERGHTTEIWAPHPRFYKLTSSKMKKWLGYIDQFLVFPSVVRKRLPKYASNTLFIFTDQALGPWVPLVSNRPHVIHCHDFLAQRSALGEIPENLTGFTGRQYQAYIRQGYSKGKVFISVSQQTRNDLHRFLPTSPLGSEVIYNGLNGSYELGNIEEARDKLKVYFKIELQNGYLLHVGGNQWYKNRLGVIELYNAWRTTSRTQFPLLMIGAIPSKKLSDARDHSPFGADIHFINNLSDEFVRLAYQGASIFLFPSFAEGFGWPIAEAMASGCPVITTDEAPMTEVAGKAGFLIPRRPQGESDSVTWAIEGAKMINFLFNLPLEERANVVQAGIIQARKFNTELALDRIEVVYRRIFEPEVVGQFQLCNTFLTPMVF